MKLIRFGKPGAEKPGVLLDDQTRLDVSSFVSDYDEEFFGSGGLARLRQKLMNGHVSTQYRVSPLERLGPPIRRPSKIVCVGLNYRDHAAESGMQLPSEPVLFFKATSALVGPNDTLVIPRSAEKVDWEVELAVIIEKEARYVPKEQAGEVIAGYALHNDYSERSFQLERGGQWMKGKSADTFAPLGPFLATRDEVPKPDQLAMWLTVNGEIRQKSTTAEMSAWGCAPQRTCGQEMSWHSESMAWEHPDRKSLRGNPAAKTFMSTTGRQSPARLQPESHGG
jgi:2-keto-4-pentenoate hydratase/2-oxohepta-3-ene-1,7-dioic acid hydratase in catechol pathway